MIKNWKCVSFYATFLTNFGAPKGTRKLFERISKKIEANIELSVNRSVKFDVIQITFSAIKKWSEIENVRQLRAITPLRPNPIRWCHNVSYNELSVPSFHSSGTFAFWEPEARAPQLMDGTAALNGGEFEMSRRYFPPLRFSSPPPSPPFPSPILTFFDMDQNIKIWRMKSATASVIDHQSPKVEVQNSNFQVSWRRYRLRATFLEDPRFSKILRVFFLFFSGDFGKFQRFYGTFQRCFPR